MSQALSGGQLLVEALIEHGVPRLFCVPGESFLAVLDALYDVTEHLPMITCRHESGAALMAAATAQLSGQVGVCFVTRGPGATNASIALHVARQASIPLLLCVGQVARENLGRESFQELDYEKFFAPLAKHVEQITIGETLPGAVARALHIARSGRPGPVVLALPEDVLSATTFAASEPARPVQRRGFDAAQLETIKDRLGQATRPLIVFGGGIISDAMVRDLEQFAQRNHVPVCVSWRRNDAFDNEHPSYVGSLGFNAHPELWNAVSEADCILVLGARLDEPSTRAYTMFDVQRPRDLIHVYPNQEDIGRNYPPTLGICADISEALAALATTTLMANEKREAWCKQLRAAFVSSRHPPQLEGGLDPGEIMQSLDRLLPKDTIVSVDAGNFSLWPQRYRSYSRPGRMLAPINGAMGWGVPGAIAAALDQPQRQVLGCVGDGGMLMTGMELATAAKYGAKPLILVFNNSKFGTIEMHQDRRYPGRRIANTLVNPDFAAFARSFGLFGARVTDNAEFDAVLPAALAADSAAVIELVMQDI
jgi:acetolactate synthase I/II/III large subunit